MVHPLKAVVLLLHYVCFAHTLLVIAQRVFQFFFSNWKTNYELSDWQLFLHFVLILRWCWLCEYSDHCCAKHLCNYEAVFFGLQFCFFFFSLLWIFSNSIIIDHFFSVDKKRTSIWKVLWGIFIAGSLISSIFGPIESAAYWKENVSSILNGIRMKSPKMKWLISN